MYLPVPEAMTQAAHRAAIWGRFARILRTLLRADEKTRNFFAPLAITMVSRVDDKALRRVLEVVVEHEKLELAAVDRWKLVRIAPEDPSEELFTPYARRAANGSPAER
jgi:hypothetical protein